MTWLAQTPSLCPFGAAREQFQDTRVGVTPWRALLIPPGPTFPLREKASGCLPLALRVTGAFPHKLSAVSHKRVVSRRLVKFLRIGRLCYNALETAGGRRVG